MADILGWLPTDEAATLAAAIPVIDHMQELAEAIRASRQAR
jgi:hypothetical protein